jgi:hypothetical protein
LPDAVHLRRLLAALLITAVIALVTSSCGGSAAPASLSGSAAISGDSKTDCIYTENDLSVLFQVDKLLHHTYQCALVFNNDPPSWEGWTRPWFLSSTVQKEAWAAWAAAPGAHRQLIITQGLFPGSLDSTDWLRAGASGTYEGYARELATNLVAAHLGSSVIRLAPEANDTGEPYSLVTTPADLQMWREFWRRTVLAMRSVPGAHFQFDWCINAAYRDIPLADYYPGNDVVNIIGIDSYDDGVTGTGTTRWNQVYDQPGGIATVLAFAKANNKPLSIPEWGLDTAADGGAGDDPDYVNGIVRVVANNNVAFQSYFFHNDFATALTTSPNSLSAYKAAFTKSGS